MTTVSIEIARSHWQSWGRYMRADKKEKRLDYPSIDTMYALVCPQGAGMCDDEPVGFKTIQTVYLSMSDDQREVIDFAHLYNKSERFAAASLGISSSSYRNKLKAAENYTCGYMQARRDFP